MLNVRARGLWVVVLTSSALGWGVRTAAAAAAADAGGIEAVSPRLSLSLTGRNLLHAHHVEFINLPNTVQIGRSVYLDARWQFD